MMPIVQFILVMTKLTVAAKNLYSLLLNAKETVKWMVVSIILNAMPRNTHAIFAVSYFLLIQNAQFLSGLILPTNALAALKGDVVTLSMRGMTLFFYFSYGGLFFHHQTDNRDFHEYQNDVYIMGGNGITTYAIASIFVDRDLRKSALKCSSNCSLLKELQQSICNSYIENFSKRLEKMPIISNCEKFGISFTSKNSMNGDKNSMADITEKIKQHVYKLLAPYFLPFISYYECSGLRHSLEIYLQEFFARDMRNQCESAMQIDGNKIQDANQTDPELHKSLSEASDLIAKEKEFWGSYTHNIVIDYLIQKIIDTFMEPLEKGCYVEAICKVNVSQHILENTKNPWQTIKSCEISLVSSYFNSSAKKT